MTIKEFFSDLVRRLTSREFVAFASVFAAANAQCWYGKIDGTAWTAACLGAAGALIGARAITQAVALKSGGE